MKWTQIFIHGSRCNSATWLYIIKPSVQLICETHESDFNSIIVLKLIISFFSYHCVLHQEQMCSKLMAKRGETMDSQMIVFLSKHWNTEFCAFPFSFPSTHCLHFSLCSKIKRIHIWTHSEVRWLRWKISFYAGLCNCFLQLLSAGLYGHNLSWHW